MSDNAGATPGANSAAPVADGPLNVREAAGAIAALRQKPQDAPQPAQDAPQSEEPLSAPAAEEPAPVEVQDGGEAGQKQPEPQADEPAPIEPPRSWTKDEKERFQSLPRETQEYIAQRERERETELRRGQNEAAEKAKAISAKEEALESARQQYESALPALLQALQNVGSDEFSDIKSMDDVRRLATEDPLRYSQWDAHQKQVQAVQSEVQQAQQRQAEAQVEQFRTFSEEQDKLFLEAAPEFADEAKREPAQKLVRSYLSEMGVDDATLADLWTGKQNVSLRHHKMQQVIYDAARWRNAQKAAKEVAARPVPPVQRPGVAPTRGEGEAAKVQTLHRTLKETGSIRDAAALIAARRARS